MGWPQITIIAMYAAGVALAAALHGQPRPPYSLWSQLFAVAIGASLLYAGGFFRGVN